MRSTEKMPMVGITLLILVIFAVPVFAGMEEIISDRSGATKLVDGKTGDWAKLSGIFFEEQKASLAVANDSEFLYLLFRTSDLQTARTIKMAGMTVYFNIEGKKKKDFYLKFRGGPAREQMRRRGQDRMEELERTEGMDDERPMGKEPKPALTCYIKDRIVEKEIPLDGTEGPMAAYDTSMGFYVYEFRVPLDSGAVRYFGLGAKGEKPIAIGLEWGNMEGMKRRMEGRASGGFGGGPEGGMPPGGIPGGMGRGGDFGGERPEGRSGDRPEMPKKQEVWVKAKLAN